VATQRFHIEPAGPPGPRARGRIVAKGVSRRVQAIVPLGGDRVAIAHHEGLSTSPGGIIVLGPDFAAVASAAGVFGPLEASGGGWLAAGPLWRGRHASARVLDPETLAVLDTLPLCAPFARIGARRILLHTPVRAAGDVGGAFRELETRGYSRSRPWRSTPRARMLPWQGAGATPTCSSSTPPAGPPCESSGSAGCSTRPA
jgi:hypothetical protein